MRALFLVLLLTGCIKHHRGAYPTKEPPPLPAAAVPLDPRDVLLSFAPFRWNETAGSNTEFPVMVSTDPGETPRIPGRVLGMLRSQLRSIDAADRHALFCDWGPGDCDAPQDGARRAHAHLTAVVDGLRAEAARVGASDVRAIRCFVRASGPHGLLWCEGRGTTGVRDPRWSAPPEPVLVARPVIEPSPWRLAASFTAGRYGDRFVSGTTLDLTYRHVTTAFHMVAPFDHLSAGLGLDVLIRRRVGAQATAVAGVTAMGLLVPSSTVAIGHAREAGAPAPRSGLAVGPVLGVGLETESFSLFRGFGKPFLQVRGGYLVARGDRELAGPNVEVVLGLVTP